ncbi:hypothetical protein [Cyanobium sp. CH-040]|uniref:hypothetical protein n=1 Tax=Cyanobium sp. CH-040 TaxID=2823708 RepID=UPI0020CDA6CC|nr:hypothetical protein [Cyanobium sp. CH-040]
MAVNPADTDQLLDALVAGLPPDPLDTGSPSTGWVALAGHATARNSPSQRFSERTGQAGVVVCRDGSLAAALSTARGTDAVLHATAPLPELLAEGQLPRPRLLFIETASAPGSDLKLKLADPPALLVATLPERGWRRRWCIRRLHQQLARMGYHCLAEGRREAIYRHRHATPPAGVPRVEGPAAAPRLRIHSFDYWDTLITRWHPDPKVVFDYVGERAGIENFRALRVQAERQARRQHPDYNLEHIYDALVQAGAIPAERREAIRELELQAEQEFAQPVRANLDRLQAGDVLISDMYLTADQMRRIARPYADLDRQPFLVSAGGKSSSSMWRELRKAGIAAHHLGDNYMADYVRAARRDHQVSLVRECGYSPLEKRFHQAGLVGLANLMRLQRLAIPLASQRLGQPATALDGLLTVQRRFNLPLLYLVALELIQRGLQPDAPSHLLFCSRDCGYLHGIYRAMAQACASGTVQDGSGRLPIDHYYLTSRKAKARASTGYVAYSRSLLGGGPERPDVLVVDVQGSGQSSHLFFRDQLGLPLRQLFIYTNLKNLESYQAEGLLPRHFVRRLLPQACDLLEVMNYSTDHSVLDMHQLAARGFIPEFEAEMRPQRLLDICRAFGTFFHGVKQRMQQSPFQHLFLRHDLRNYRREHLELLHDVDGLEDLRLLRELYLRFHRRH